MNDIEPLWPGRGVEPLVQQRVNAKDEANACVRWLLDRRRAGCAWRDMAVLAPGKRNWREPIVEAFERDGVPGRFLLGDKAAAPALGDDHVHVMTLHAMQGLEFPVVAVVGIGDLPWKQQTLDEAARLLHGAMANATRALAVSYSKQSALVDRLLAARGGVRKPDATSP